MSFQKKTVTVAIVIFFIAICTIAILLNNAKHNAEFPPEIGACPDYWKLDTQGKCFNPVSGLGNCYTPMNFNQKKYIGLNGPIERCNWAKKCKISWDGISNRGLC